MNSVKRDIDEMEKHARVIRNYLELEVSWHTLGTLLTARGRYVNAWQRSLELRNEDERARHQAAVADLEAAAAELEAHITSTGPLRAIEAVVSRGSAERVRWKHANNPHFHIIARAWVVAVEDGRNEGFSTDGRNAEAVVKDLQADLAEQVERTFKGPWALMTLGRPYSSHNGSDLLVELFSVRDRGGAVLVLAPMAVREHFTNEGVLTVRFARTEYDPRLKETLSTLWGDSFDDNFSDLKQLAAVAHGLI